MSKIEQMVKDFKAMGLEEEDVVLVHSSFKSLGLEKGDGEPRDVIEALKLVLGEDGTLLLPSLSYEYCHEGQRKFDLTTMKSCVGVIPETFRKMEGVVRSMHPTHSVSGWGKMARALLGEHHLDDTPCGGKSPFAKVRDVGGKVLMLGCGLEPNTSMHGVEELVKPRYLFAHEVEYEVRVGNEPWRCAGEGVVDGKMVNWRHGHSQRGYVQRYDRMEKFMDEGVGVKGKTLEAECWLMDAQKMWEVGVREMSKKELYFVDELKIGS
ncbi:AAC(3) family N-acetyltransferase [Planctomycetota bacterium]|nr:AAC(3) family N-acetyltransferase [Planctomycetota bacterium]